MVCRKALAARRHGEFNDVGVYSQLAKQAKAIVYSSPEVIGNARVYLSLERARSGTRVPEEPERRPARTRSTTSTNDQALAATAVPQSKSVELIVNAMITSREQNPQRTRWKRSPPIFPTRRSYSSAGSGNP